MPNDPPMTGEAGDLLYGVPDIARFLNLRRQQVYHLVAKGKLPTFRIKDTRRICALKSKLSAWLKEQQAGTPPNRVLEGLEKDAAIPRPITTGGTGSPEPKPEGSATMEREATPMRAKLQVSARVLPDGVPFTLRGREAWALQRLVVAGPSGCTPIDQPAPRWSHYIFQLRKTGLVIETIHEQHGGTFAGNHGRYVLHSPVAILSEERASA